MPELAPKKVVINCVITSVAKMEAQVPKVVEQRSVETQTGKKLDWSAFIEYNPEVAKYFPLEYLEKGSVSDTEQEDS